MYTQKVLNKFADFLAPPQKIRKCLLPSDASERMRGLRVYLDNFPYCSQLVALLYLSMNTRPDIAYAVELLSRFGT